MNIFSGTQILYLSVCLRLATLQRWRWSLSLSQSLTECLQTSQTKQLNQQSLPLDTCKTTHRCRWIIRFNLALDVSDGKNQSLQVRMIINQNKRRVQYHYYQTEILVANTNTMFNIYKKLTKAPHLWASSSSRTIWWISWLIYFGITMCLINLKYVGLRSNDLVNHKTKINKLANSQTEVIHLHTLVLCDAQANVLKVWVECHQRLGSEPRQKALYL